MKWAFWIFLVFSAVALALFGIATFGLFGQERDPLGGLFLLPLGLPWNMASGLFGSASGVFAALAPCINLALIHWIWKRRGQLPTK